ncbi:hypothetical protein PAE9249_03206 [Paenibacillus sp. CECT 9249]|nr:hypothetical protein PAE9249_03206 [Paenibacillus sp. CECT 9249]
MSLMHAVAMRTIPPTPMSGLRAALGGKFRINLTLISKESTQQAAV